MLLFIFSVSKQIFQFAIFDVKLVNTFDNCYFFYGLPTIGIRDYNNNTGEFQGTTEWKEVCTLPWGRNEQEVRPIVLQLNWIAIRIKWEKKIKFIPF